MTRAVTTSMHDLDLTSPVGNLGAYIQCELDTVIPGVVDVALLDADDTN